MAEVSIVVNGRSYDIACDDGQEDRVQHLAMYIDQRLRQIAGKGRAWNEGHIFVLTALVLADELFETKEALTAASRPVAAPARKPMPEASVAVSRADDQALAQAVEQLIRRIDGISAKVEAA